jgi:hypothetical protein
MACEEVNRLDSEMDLDEHLSDRMFRWMVR